MNKDEIVCVVSVSVTRERLVDILENINEYVTDPDSESGPITIEECLSNQELREYICFEAVQDGVALYDPLEFIRNDGWADIEDYRS